MGYMPLIPLVTLWLQGLPDLHSEFQVSQGYTLKPCPKKKERKEKMRTSKGNKPEE